MKRRRRKKLHIWDTIKDVLRTFLTGLVIIWLLVAGTYSTFKSTKIAEVAKETIVDKVKDFMIARGIKALLP